MAQMFRILGKRGRITIPFEKEAEDTITLFDFLNGLSDEQQKAAFAHLKLKWDRVQGSGLYGRS